MNKFLAFCLLFFGCSQQTVQTKKYMVISMFNDVVLETDEKAEAYEYAHNLTSMGRVLASKPVYFVLEKK